MHTHSILEVEVPACVLVPAGRKYKLLLARFAFLTREDGSQLEPPICLYLMGSLDQKTTLLKIMFHSL